MGRVMSHPAAVCFVPYLELPIPWDFILNHYERCIFYKFFRLCGCTLTIDEHKSSCFHGRELWDIHCHCQNPESLQCLSTGKILKMWCKQVLRGAFYNAQFPFYRYVANYYHLTTVRYVGSLFVNRVHLIYLHFKKENDLKYVLSGWLGKHRFVDCTLNSWLILKCISCKHLTEIQARVCARRTRKIIKKICCHIALHRRRALRRNPYEILRQKMFSRLLRYGITFDREDYMLTV